MEYNEVLDFLFSQLPMYQRSGKVAYKANLDNTLKLDKYFNHPHMQFKVVHVAGTNGKGSVSHCLASVIQEAGYKVGLYTSPHLKDFRERIKINGNCISESEVINFVENHKDIINEIKPSFFEMTVAMAFHYFATEKIDIAVVEVGLGGRLDSTNIVSPVCSVITNIGLDHTALLGDTYEKIATEKAGIIKKEIPVIIGETDNRTKKIFDNVANNNKSTILYADQVFDIHVAMSGIDGTQVLQVYKRNKLVYENLKLDLLGKYQQSNVKTVLQTIELLSESLKININHIYKGLGNVVKNTGIMGRWQILNTNPVIICDTAHNVEGVKHIIEQLSQTAYKKLHIVLGMVNDKDITRVLKLLPPNATYYFTQAKIPRAMDALELKNVAMKEGLKGENYNSVVLALEEAKKKSGVNDLIFIGGSTFVVAEII